MYHQYREFYTVRAGAGGRVPSFWLYSWTWGWGALSWSASWPGGDIWPPCGGRGSGHGPCGLNGKLLKLNRGMLWCQGDRLALDWRGGMVILCIDPDSDSDVVIEEEEGDFREGCIIARGNEQNVEGEAEQADDEWSGPLTTMGAEPGASLAAESGKLKTKMKQFPALQLRILMGRGVGGSLLVWPPIVGGSERVSRNW